MSAGGTATSAVVPGLAAIGHPSSSARLQAQLGGSACGCSTGIQTQARFGDDAGSRDVGLGVVGGSQRSRRSRGGRRVLHSQVTLGHGATGDAIRLLPRAFRTSMMSKILDVSA